MARSISEIIWERNKNWEVVTFPFTLLEEGRKVCSCEGNHILAIFKEPEKYKSVKQAIIAITSEVEKLTHHWGKWHRILYPLVGTENS